MVLKELVETLRDERRPQDGIAKSVEKKVISNAKIIVSTLNFCGSARMHQLKLNTEFIIIDEGKL